ncbi:MAG: hypothetical protein LVS60_07770 [Nodosilinea sp. LVE1205-7]|jgi:hypothetical protein
MGFRNLRLEDRFWHRLNDLAEQIQQQARAKRALATAALAADQSSPSELTAFAGEVVIYEDEGTATPMVSPVPPSPQPLVPALDQLTPPLPHLTLPPGERLGASPFACGYGCPSIPIAFTLRFGC